MITNFEEITSELNERELKLIPLLISGFKSHGVDDPIKAPEIVKKMNEYLSANNFGLKMTEPRLRKCCNHIRANGMIPLIATSQGYYVSKDPEIIQSQINSLIERANSIMNCAEGLKRFLPLT
jgi:hypothetical protein